MKKMKVFEDIEVIKVKCLHCKKIIEVPVGVKYGLKLKPFLLEWFRINTVEYNSPDEITFRDPDTPIEPHHFHLFVPMPPHC